MKLKIFTVFLVVAYSLQCFAQDLYVGTTDGNNLFFGQLNLSTCTFCSEMQVPLTVFPTGVVSLIALPGPNGLVAGIDGGGAVLVFDPPNTVPLATINAPSNVIFQGAELAPDGTVLITAIETVASGIEICIYRFNPVGNALSEVGCFPMGTWTLGDIYFWNGQLYAFAFNLQNGGEPTLINITLGPVLSASIVQVFPSFFCGGNTTSIPGGPNAGIYGTNLASGCSGVTIVESDPNGNPDGISCSLSTIGILGISAVPPGFPASSCNTCTTEAGTITTNANSLCTNALLQVTQTGSTLDANDLTQYLVSTTLSNLSGSAVLTSNSPNIAFASPLMVNTTYYVSAFTGNNVSNSVDFDDPCLDSTNAVAVIWRPLPAVVLSVAGGNNNLCAGQCRIITASFTGTSPFTLTYNTSFGGPFSQTFNGNTGTFQVCAPANAAPGPLTVQATQLVDFRCTCE